MSFSKSLSFTGSSADHATPRGGFWPCVVVGEGGRQAQGRMEIEEKGSKKGKKGYVVKSKKWLYPRFPHENPFNHISSISTWRYRGFTQKVKDLWLLCVLFPI